MNQTAVLLERQANGETIVQQNVSAATCLGFDAEANATAINTVVGTSFYLEIDIWQSGNNSIGHLHVSKIFFNVKRDFKL